MVKGSMCGKGGGRHGEGGVHGGAHAWQEGMCGRDACIVGGMCGRGVHSGGKHGRRDGHCSRWYASY